MRPRLELTDIQGNTVFGYSFPCVRYFFLGFDDPARGRQFVRSLEPEVTTSARWERKPDATLNIAFSHKGLAALDVPARSLGSFPPEFRQGMRARAELLQDTGRNSPQHWDEVWRAGEVHALLTIYARDDATLDVRSARIQEGLAQAGVRRIGSQDAAKLIIDGKASSLEHFGYRDGISNPDVDGTGVPAQLGDGKLRTDGGWDPLAAGEVILGQPDEALETPQAPVPMQLARNGTYLVYRKLHQNVASFRHYLHQEGMKYPGGPYLLAAKILGRWPDGVPLELAPKQTDPGIAADARRINDFHYADDPAGVRCPLSAHIRRSNPRDADGFGGTITNRHRFLRRGMPYGAWIPPDQEADDDGEHGMIFVAVNVSIERQFEFVLQQWMNYGNDFLQGDDRDLLVGTKRPGNKMVIQGDPAEAGVLKRPYLCANFHQFVETRGGDYFFVPGLNALRHIGRGSVDTH